MIRSFIIGEQRSGTNLLRTMLDQSNVLACPHPPHILQHFVPLVALYGDLSIDHNFALLVDDVCCLVEANPVLWETTQFDRDSVASLALERSVFGVFVALMDHYALSCGMHGWVCKSTHNTPWANELARLCPGAKFIYVYRDPRDVCASYLRAPVGEKHSYFIAMQWAQRQQACVSFEEAVGTQSCYRVVYEQLISEPASVLIRLCEFLDIEYHEKMLSPQHSNESLKAANVGKQWKNLVKPVMSENSGGYKTKLTAHDIHIIETCALNEMQALGYQADIYPDQGPIVFSKDDINAFSQINDALKATMTNDSSVAEVSSKTKMNALKNSIVKRYASSTT